MQKIIPHAISIALLFLISAAFYSPALLKGERMHQGDTINFKGMSHEAKSYSEVSETGDLPSWTDSMFSGMPTTQITGSGLMSLPKIIWLFLRLFMSPEIMTLFMAMIAGYVLALCLKAPPWIAFIVGATYGLASVNILYLSAGHATKVRAISVMPGVLGGVVAAFRGKRALGAGIFALFLSIHLYANHLQMTYYLLFLIGFVGISEFIFKAYSGQIKQALTTSLLLLAAGFFAILPQSAELALTNNYSHHTTRGEAVLTNSTDNLETSNSGLKDDYILEYSMSRAEWMSMIVPNIKGGGDQLYWGEQRFSGGAFYFGAIAFALMLAFFFVGRDPLRFPLMLISILAIILSWRDASALSDFFLNHVPLFNKFRDTKMMLVIVQVAVAAGGALALKEIWEDAANGKWKPWVFSLLGISLVLFIFYFSPTTFFDFTSSIRSDQALIQLGKNSVTQLRIDIFKSDVLRSLSLIAICAAAVYMILKGILDKRIIISVLAVIMISELALVDKRYSVNWVDSFEALYPFEPNSSDLAILEFESKDLQGFPESKAKHIAVAEEKLGYKLSRRHAKASFAASFNALNSLTHYRVLDWGNPFNDARTSYFHKSVGGYHGAKLRRYQDFIDEVLVPERGEFASIAGTSGVGLAMSSLRALTMLNTKYIILPGAETPLQLPGSLGPAWIANEIKWVETPEAEIDNIRAVDLATTAIIHKEFESKISFESSNNKSHSSVSLQNYHPEGSVYLTESDDDGIMIFSEVWYSEGWKAFVDGIETPIFRANYILRAIELPQGTHTVELKFKLPGRKLASLVNGVGSILLLIFLFGTMFYAIKK